MCTPEPCKGCRNQGSCIAEPLINRLAVYAWLDNTEFKGCEDKVADNYCGVEGVLA